MAGVQAWRAGNPSGGRAQRRHAARHSTCCACCAVAVVSVDVHGTARPATRSGACTVCPHLHRPRSAHTARAHAITRPPPSHSPAPLAMTAPRLPPQRLCSLSPACAASRAASAAAPAPRCWRRQGRPARPAAAPGGSCARTRRRIRAAAQILWSCCTHAAPRASHPPPHKALLRSRLPVHGLGARAARLQHDATPIAAVPSPGAR